jgi:PPOX class probable F420-dependent enzyme
MKLKGLSDEDVRALLAKPVVAKLATHGRNGEMRITPVWFKAIDGELHVNTLEHTDLARNLRRNPRCSVLVDTTEPPDVTAVHYWGTATVDMADADGIANIVERYVGSAENAQAVAQRNLSMGPVVYIRFRPERMVSWDLRQ